MYTMHQSYRTQKYVHSVVKVVIQRFDRAIAWVITTEHPYNVIKAGLCDGKIISRVDELDDADCISPDNFWVSIGKKAIYFSK